MIDPRVSLWDRGIGCGSLGTLSQSFCLLACKEPNQAQWSEGGSPTKRSEGGEGSTGAISAVGYFRRLSADVSEITNIIRNCTNKHDQFEDTPYCEFQFIIENIHRSQIGLNISAADVDYGPLTNTNFEHSMAQCIAHTSMGCSSSESASDIELVARGNQTDLI